jgi:hypothetical protein
MFREEMRQELIKAAVERRTVTYGYLMEKFGISRGSSEGDTVVGALGEIDRREYQAGAPGFAAIVVRKDTGYPGGGFFCWDGVPAELRRRKEEGGNPQLSDPERRYIKQEQEKIWSYYLSRYPTHHDLGSFTEDR